MLITDPRKPDNPIIFVNDAFLKLTGNSREENIGKNCRFLQGPGTDADDINRVRDTIQSLEPIEIDLLNYRKDGSVFWNRLLVSPVFSNEILTYFVASQLDVTRERTTGHFTNRDHVGDTLQQRIADLTGSEERLQFTLKAGGLGTWIWLRRDWLHPLYAKPILDVHQQRPSHMKSSERQYLLPTTIAGSSLYMKLSQPMVS
ncbi:MULTISPECIES: PAS domain-containing protein [unclassified Ochrobactrum]|uniref:PAS domain-containing protein n=1 Tax=unclassified Ochrobactrum TaxID=239106 RepID=UPI00309ED79F